MIPLLISQSHWNHKAVHLLINESKPRCVNAVCVCSSAVSMAWALKCVRFCSCCVYARSLTASSSSSTRPPSTCCVLPSRTSPGGDAKVYLSYATVQSLGLLRTLFGALNGSLRFATYSGVVGDLCVVLFLSYPNLKSVRELIYKRGYGKIKKQRIPLTDNALIEKSLGKKTKNTHRGNDALAVTNSLQKTVVKMHSD